MLGEVEELQEEAVRGILRALEKQDEVTFKAPTGSGKTHMMADLMNRVLTKDPKAVFLVSTLSKGGLAEQNFEKFKEYGKEFPKLSPYLIHSEDSSGEARPFIDPGYNVYVIGRDSFKRANSKLTNLFPAFLQKEVLDGKYLYLIKDECHQATKNLDELKDRFRRRINFSATPKSKQVPDVELREEDAENCSLIKRVEWGSDDADLEEAIEKFEEVKKRYEERLKSDPNYGKFISPCLIIQISNKEKADEELKGIGKVLLNHPNLIWARIVDKDKDCDTNDLVLKRSSPSRWNEELKKDSCPVNVIIFKMVITEGWDIPRACMLYQIRDAKSKILDEQVLGRIRRNSKLLNFEELDKESQDLVTKAWAWGLKPNESREKRKVKLSDPKVQKVFKIRTTDLPSSGRMPSEFNLKELVLKEPYLGRPQSIFPLYSDSKKAPEAVRELEKDFVKSISDWYEFCSHLPSIIKKTKEVIDNPSNLTVKEEEVSFPKESYYLKVPGQESEKIPEWIWKREGDEPNAFSFDSQAEEKWVSILQDLAEDGEVKTIASDLFNGPIYLLGKNFLPNSQISYAYTMEGEAVLHSYPDFIMEGADGTVYVFEVKSMAESKDQNILDAEAYKNKVEALKRWYKATSKKLAGYVFCVPVWGEEGSKDWRVYLYEDGKAAGETGSELGVGSDFLTRKEFKDFIKSRNRTKN